MNFYHLHLQTSLAPSMSVAYSELASVSYFVCFVVVVVGGILGVGFAKVTGYKVQIA